MVHVTPPPEFALAVLDIQVSIAVLFPLPNLLIPPLTLPPLPPIMSQESFKSTQIVLQIGNGVKN